VMVDAFDTDIRPLLMQVRTEKGLDPNPLAAYRADEYVKKVAKERGITISAGSALQ
jgi:L-rhamnose isomerase / sugar isomerase